MRKNFASRIGYGVVLLLGLGLTCFLGSRFYFRLDLTEERRYSVHVATKQLLRALEEEMSIEIYLAGDLPTGLKQLKRATQALLEECKVYNPLLRYDFVDLEKMSAAEKKACLLKLAALGIQPTNLSIEEKGQRTEKFIFPGARLRYKGKERGMLLLQGNKMCSQAQMINQSMEGLEYALASSMEQLVRTERKKIALLRGHGEPDLAQLSGLANALEAHYGVHAIAFSAQTALAAYDALFITQPQQPFSEAEKYLLDQYIMQGGKVLFFLDRLRMKMDNLGHGEAFAFPLDTRLEDQLFRYGVRINLDLVQDLYAGVYPVVVGNLGNQPQLRLMPWPFFPLLNCFGDHLVTKNMDVLAPQFVSSMDPIRVEGVKQTPLAFTSQYARRMGAPVHVDLEALRKAPNPNHYNQGPIPLAFLLEGTFTSLYKNRFLPQGIEATTFLPESKPTKLLVFASGSLVLNGMDPRKKKPLPWGYDPFLQQRFANQDFVLNTLAYMLNEEGLIGLKNKTLKIRLLDKVRIVQERLAWQLLNLLAPMLLLGALGLLWNYLYRRAYTRF